MRDAHCALIGFRLEVVQRLIGSARLELRIAMGVVQRDPSAMLEQRIALRLVRHSPSAALEQRFALELGSVLRPR